MHGLGDAKIRDAGLDDGAAIGYVDLQDLVEFPHGEKHAILEGQSPSGQRRARAARHHVDLVRRTVAQDLGDLRRGLRQHDNHGQLAISCQAVAFIGAALVLAVDHALAGDDAPQRLDNLGSAGKNRPVGFWHLDHCAPAYCRDHPRDEILLRGDKQAEQQSQDDAVQECPGEDLALMALQLGDGDARRDVLRRDHLAHDAARRVRGGEQDRVQAELAGGDDLEIAEQRIARCVAAREHDGDPAKEGREQDEQLSRRGDALAERVGQGRNSSSDRRDR